MKIIELLNKIANGEEVPDNFKYREYLFYYDEYNNCYFEEGNKNLFDILAYLKGWSLTDEVEIIENKIEEEKKIPEKIPEEIIVGKKQPVHRIKKIEKKINEIIDYLDYLKSKGDE